MELIFYIARLGIKITFYNFNSRISFVSMDCYDFFLVSIAIIIYNLHNIWLLYGNYLYYSLPATDENDVAWFSSQRTSGEIRSEKWLYLTMTVICAFSGFYLILFFALIICTLCYYVLYFSKSQEEMLDYSELHPFRLWLLCDGGIFLFVDVIGREED